jgi:hypothetical protein
MVLETNIFDIIIGKMVNRQMGQGFPTPVTSLAVRQAGYWSGSLLPGRKTDRQAVKTDHHAEKKKKSFFFIDFLISSTEYNMQVPCP